MFRNNQKQFILIKDNLIESNSFFINRGSSEILQNSLFSFSLGSPKPNFPPARFARRAKYKLFQIQINQKQFILIKTMHLNQKQFNLIKLFFQSFRPISKSIESRIIFSKSFFNNQHLSISKNKDKAYFQTRCSSPWDYDIIIPGAWLGTENRKSEAAGKAEIG